MSVRLLVQLACKKQGSEFLIKKTLEHTTSMSHILPNKEHFFVLLTKSAGCLLSGSEQCCYRAFDWMNKNVAVAQYIS